MRSQRFIRLPQRLLFLPHVSPSLPLEEKLVQRRLFVRFDTVLIV